MKRFCTLIFSSLLVLSLYAQLNADHNSLRSGDVIIKQQVQYKDPGKVGENLLWDFSELELINDQYELVYSDAPLIGDSIYVMGYTNLTRKRLKRQI